jgi:dephospho-CoA kinase
LSSRPYVIGLTGNIATGKSLIAQMLGEWGAEHVDADRLAHRAMARGTATWTRIVDAFGEGILGPEGEVDRARLGAIVFSAPDAMARLEAIVHPDVIARTRARIAHSSARVVVVEAIKLIESGMVAALCDALWVVTAPREVQIARLIVGRGMSHADAVLRVDAQPPQAQKVARADVVIDNGGSIEAARAQVMRAWAEIDLSGRPIRRAERGDGR